MITQPPTPQPTVAEKRIPYVPRKRIERKRMCTIQDAEIAKCHFCGSSEPCHRFTSIDDWVCYSCTQKAIGMYFMAGKPGRNLHD